MAIYHRENPPPDELIPSLWAKATLYWLLAEHQQVIHRKVWASIKNEDIDADAVNCDRQTGKTFTLMTVATEYCLRNPGAVIYYVGPESTQIKRAIKNALRVILKTCPVGMQPHINLPGGLITFPNTATIIIVGTDNQRADNQRGGLAHVIFVDEGGFMDDLNYVYLSVLSPMCSSTGGTIIFSSTPPKTADHDYVTIFRDLQSKGLTTTLTIYDNKTKGWERRLEKAIREAGGTHTVSFRRERLCEFVVDDQLQIIHDWADKYEADLPIEEYYRRHWHRYTALDLGTRDFSACIFAYYDFLNARLVVEDEVIENGPTMTTNSLAKAIKDKEAALWPGLGAPYQRVSDNSLGTMLTQMGAQDGLYFQVTNKDTLEAMVNKVRVWVATGRIYVSPKCKHLIGCLRYGIWSSKHTGAREFARSGVYGHYDALAALVYMVRNVDEHENPLPVHHGLTDGMWVGNTDLNQHPSPAGAELAKIFG
jgi:hypothetical protein